MSQNSASLTAIAPSPGSAQAPARRRSRVFTELFKVRLNALVLLTTGVGFYLAAGTVDWALFVFTLVGTALTAFAASALNQVWEVEHDARMPRTMRRPLPAGQISASAALTIAIALAVVGTATLALFANPLAAVLAAGCLLLYVFVYTPMKVRTPLNTLVGAIVGAIPPLVGWVAAAGRIELGGLVLAAILFIWQIPHFLALAWLYRDQYALGGFRMLPLTDPTGVKTCQAIVLYSMALIPTTLLLTAAGVVGWWYAAGAFVLGAAMTWCAFDLYGVCERSAARRVFLASVIYLPLLLGLMVLDRATPQHMVIEFNPPPPAAVHDETRLLARQTPAAAPKAADDNAALNQGEPR